MSKLSAKRPRILYAFATLFVALVFYACAYAYTAIATPEKLERQEALEATSQQADANTSSSTASKSVDKDKSTDKGGLSSVSSSSSSEQPHKNTGSSSDAEAKADKNASSSSDTASAKPRSVAHKLGGSVAAKLQKSDAYAGLTQAVGSFEDRGYTVAFVLHDIASGDELTYNDQEELYPASSIKAPFTCSVYQELVDKGKVPLDEVSPVAKITITESSDEGYRQLHASYGEDAFVTWLKDAGVGPGSYGDYPSMVQWNYPHICAEQFGLMWQRVYAYINSGTKAAKQLGGYLEDRTVSSLRKAVGKGVRTQSKMGWFETESDYRSLPATVEGGVVYAKEGTYIIALMTNAPALLDDLVPLEKALVSAHAAVA